MFFKVLSQIMHHFQMKLKQKKKICCSFLLPNPILIIKGGKKQLYLMNCSFSVVCLEAWPSSEDTVSAFLSLTHLEHQILGKVSSKNKKKTSLSFCGPCLIEKLLFPYILLYCFFLFFGYLSSNETQPYVMLFTHVAAFFGSIRHF